MNDAISQELEGLRTKHAGILRPADVVKFAANPQTALHRQFEWDDTKAAAEYRLEQARHIIRCVVRVVDEDRPPVRVYASLQADRKGGDSYRSVADVMKKPALRKQLLEQALREAESWRARYERLAELKPVMLAITRVQRSLSDAGKLRRSA